jgi:hypothetical protein
MDIRITKISIVSSCAIGCDWIHIARSLARWPQRCSANGCWRLDHCFHPHTRAVDNIRVLVAETGATGQRSSDPRSVANSPLRLESAQRVLKLDGARIHLTRERDIIHPSLQAANDSQLPLDIANHWYSAINNWYSAIQV